MFDELDYEALELCRQLRQKLEEIARHFDDRIAEIQEIQKCP